MKFKLTASIFDYKDIAGVAKELETNLNSPVIRGGHSKYTHTVQLASKKWRLTYCYKNDDGTAKNVYWELRIHKRYTNTPWFTNFLLRWK